MKLAMIFFISFFVVFGRMPEEKHKKEVEKLQQKLQREREERRKKNEKRVLEAQIRNERFLAAQPQIKAQFGLSCPVGGYDATFIHSALAGQYLYWKGGGSMKVIFRRVVMVHRAKNPYENMTLDIYGGGEKIVSNMCPGGSITLVASIPPVVGGNSRQVIWTAEGVINGRLAYGESSPGSIWGAGYNYEVQMNRPSWVMNLDRVDKKF